MNKDALRERKLQTASSVAGVRGGVPGVVGRGHVSLLTNLDKCHSEPFTGIWYPLIYYHHSFREYTWCAAAGVGGRGGRVRAARLRRPDLHGRHGARGLCELKSDLDEGPRSHPASPYLSQLEGEIQTVDPKIRKLTQQCD